MQNFVFSCLPKAISNRRYSHILFLPTPVQILQFRVQNFVHAFPKPFQIEDIHIYYSCPPLCRFSDFLQNLVFSCLPKAISNRRYSHIYYSCPPLPVQILRFRVQNLVFSCLPKAISNRRYSHIYYSCPPLPVQILRFRVQNLVFSCLPKAISNRRYSHILFLPTPASADSPISFAKLGVFMPSQSHFK